MKCYLKVERSCQNIYCKETQVVLSYGSFADKVYHVHILKPGIYYVLFSDFQFIHSPQVILI